MCWHENEKYIQVPTVIIFTNAINLHAIIDSDENGTVYGGTHAEWSLRKMVVSENVMILPEAGA